MPSDQTSALASYLSPSTTSGAYMIVIIGAITIHQHA